MGGHDRWISEGIAVHRWTDVDPDPLGQRLIRCTVCGFTIPKEREIELIDHGDPNVPALACEVTEDVTVGPITIFFSNQNKAMGLKGHSHYAEVYVTWETLVGGHGFPSFKSTNDEVRARVWELTNNGPFRDATNEDVNRRLFAWLDGWTTAEIVKWGGEYRLSRVTLDVHSTPDKIGHDSGVTRYTVTRHPLADYKPRYITGKTGG